MGAEDESTAARPPALPVTPEQLDELVTHVGYELAALEAWAQLFARHRDWLALEGFLLHARNVRDFLYSPSRPRAPYAEHGVRAAHYSPTWSGFRGPMPPVLARTEGPIDWQLSQLSRGRLDASAPDLAADFAEIRRELAEAWALFVEHLGKDTEASRFIAATKFWADRLREPVA